MIGNTESSLPSRRPRALRTLYLEWSPLGSAADYWAPLSYGIDWRNAFFASVRLDVMYCDINRPHQVLAAASAIDSFDLIVVSHLALGDNVADIALWSELLAKRRGALVSFIGNEYDLMAEKINFLRDTRADIVCSQLSLEAARYLYSELEHSRIISLPHALNPDVYKSSTTETRTIDVGFIGAVYPTWVGDLERTMLLLATTEIAPLLGLRHDIRLQNVPRDTWAKFLRSTRAVIGGESGSYYLHRKGALLTEAKEWCADNPSAQFEEVESRFFGDRGGAPSGKTISSRHFEPIGTRTCQILLEGSYAGMLQPNEHYIPVRKDLMDLPDALRRAANESERVQMTDRAFDYVMSAHTYAHRVNALLDLL
ncbi:MAG: glycosyltransferase [Gemmatimonadota bacterium]|nr:glycosyltransferase [Gemmatimonadota bacterium]